MKKQLLNKITFCLLTGILLFSCRKSEMLSIPAEVATFAGVSGGSYYVQNSTASVYKIKVGATTVSDKERKVNFSVSSPSGAVAGTQYNLDGMTMTIPAGESFGYIEVKGLFSGYPANRRDTLSFKLEPGALQPADFNNSFDLVLQRYCDVDLNSFTGLYTQCADAGFAGVYTINVSSAVSTGPTTGYIMVENLWDLGPGSSPIRVNLDWTNPANFISSIPTGQPLNPNTGTYGQSYVRPTGNGSFSSCDNTFTLRYQVYVSAGSFAATTTTMAR